MSDRPLTVQIDPTADVHPSVILEGNVTIGPWTRIGAGVVISGNVRIGHHTLIQCNTVIRGNNTIGNWVHIYDLVCIEGGRPAKLGSSLAEEPDRSIIGDEAWINHGATMHGCQLGDGAVVDLNASLDYNCRVGAGAIVASGSALRVNTIVPEDCVVDGVPAQVVKRDITDDDRRALMGLVPREWVHYAGERQEESIRAKQGL